jgi:hypothetical protein
MNEDHPLYKAIDRGGGQTCDTAGVIRELAKAGFAIVPMDATPIDRRREEQLRIQALGAALSRRDWHATERAYSAIRDEFDRRHTLAVTNGGHQ